MKKLLSILLLAVSAIVLVACGSGQSLDGEWHEYYITSNTDELVLDDDVSFTIDKDVFKSYLGEVGKLDTKEQTISSGQDVVSYILEEDGTILLADDRFVKKDSKKYQEIKEAIDAGTDSESYKKVFEKIDSE